MKELQRENFDQEIASGDDLILYLYDPKEAASVIGLGAVKEVAGYIGKNFRIFTVDISKNPEICAALDSKDVPEFISIKNKKIHKRVQGMLFSNQILDLVK